MTPYSMCKYLATQKRKNSNLTGKDLWQDQAQGRATISRNWLREREGDRAKDPPTIGRDNLTAINTQIQRKHPSRKFHNVVYFFRLDMTKNTDVKLVKSNVKMKSQFVTFVFVLEHL